jgi:hypothetical protein
MGSTSGLNGIGPRPPAAQPAVPAGRAPQHRAAAFRAEAALRPRELGRRGHLRVFERGDLGRPGWLSAIAPGGRARERCVPAAAYGRLGRWMTLCLFRDRGELNPGPPLAEGTDHERPAKHGS